MDFRLQVFLSIDMGIMGTGRPKEDEKQKENFSWENKGLSIFHGLTCCGKMGDNSWEGCKLQTSLCSSNYKGFFFKSPVPEKVGKIFLLNSITQS